MLDSNVRALKINEAILDADLIDGRFLSSVPRRKSR
jgi:hypothetical protein